jgi:hypothetical protein
MQNMFISEKLNEFNEFKEFTKKKLYEKKLSTEC